MNSQTQKFPADFIEYLQNNSLVEIKGGLIRERFLEIWKVTYEGRVFARSWEKSKKSWFTAFLEEGTGQIKFGDQVISVKGIQVTDPALNRQVDAAYRAKYTQERNLFYVDGITQPSYYDYTMEFIFIA